MTKSLARTAIATALLIATSVAAQAGWEEGLAAFQGGDLATAAKEFQSLVDQQPEWYGGHLMLGQVQLKQDRNQDALTHLRKAYDLKPDDVNVQLPLGKAYLANGRYNEAATLLSGIDSRSLPAAKQAALQEMLAAAYDKAGRSDEALTARAAAATASPNDAGAQYRYGVAAFNAGDTDAAIRALTKAKSLDPSDVQKAQTLLQAQIRSGQEKRGDAKLQAYRSAIATAQVLVQQDPSFENQMRLGEAQLGAKDYAAAAKAFESAAAKDASSWIVQYYLGQAYTLTQQFQSAENALEKALRLTRQASDQRRIYGQLGFVYEKQKEYDSAKAAYTSAGDQAAVQRVAENQKTEEFNKDVEAEAKRLQQMEEERRKLEEELKELAGGPPPGL